VNIVPFFGRIFSKKSLFPMKGYKMPARRWTSHLFGGANIACAGETFVNNGTNLLFFPFCEHLSLFWAHFLKKLAIFRMKLQIMLFGNANFTCGGDFCVVSVMFIFKIFLYLVTFLEYTTLSAENLFTSIINIQISANVSLSGNVIIKNATYATNGIILDSAVLKIAGNNFSLEIPAKMDFYK
jgi:hypothetical protein